MADEDIAALGLSIDSGPMAVFNREGERMVVTAGNAEQSTRRLSAATQALGTATTAAVGVTERQTSAITTQSQAYDVANAAYRRAMASLSGLAAAESAAARAAQTQVNAYANAARSAEGYARVARQNMIEASDSRRRELMASVENSNAAIKAMYFGTSTAATAAATTIVAANQRIGISNAALAQRMTAQQRLMLGYQLNDIFVQASMGTNPLMIAAQQGPQITQIFGGLRNTLGRIPTAGLAAGGAALGGLGGAALLHSLASTNDALREQERRFTALIGPATGATKMYQEIRLAAAGASTSVDLVSESVEGFAKSTVTLGASRRDILDMSKAFEQLSKLGGVTEDERGAGQQALVGMFKNAIASGEQLKTVMSNMPNLAQEIAAGLGVSVTQLRLMVAQGEITNREVFDALLSRSAAINEQFERMPKGVGDQIRDIGNDLAIMAQGWSQVIPLVGQYRMAIDLAAKATKALREGAQRETNAQVIARTENLFIGGAGSSMPEMQAARSAGMQQALQERAQALRNLHAQMRLEERATAEAATKAADEIIVSANSIAKTYNELSITYQKQQQEIDVMEQALANLNAGLHNLSGEEAAKQIDILTTALQRAREQAANLDPAIKSINDINRRNEFRAIDPSAAGMARQQRAFELSGGDPAREQQAIVTAMAEQQEKAADLVVQKQREAEASTLLLDAVRKGTAATIEAKVQAMVLAFTWAHVGDMANATADQIQMVADYTAAVRTALTNEQTISKLSGGANAAKQYTDELASLAAQMKVVEQGAYAMRRAEAEAKASRADNGTGKLQLEVFDRKQELTDKQALVSLEEEIALTKDLAAAAGNVAKQKQIQLDFDIKRAQLAAGPGARDQIDLRMREQATANQARDLAEGVVAMEKQLEYTKQQTDLVRDGSADYAAQLAMLQKKNDLIKQGVDTENDGNAQRQITLAGEQARADVQLQRAKEASDATKRIWQNAFDNIQGFGADTFYDMFRGVAIDGKSAADALKNIFFRALADIAAAAIIRPIIQPVFAGIAGALGGGSAMPAAIGTSGGGGLGGLFGSGGLGGFGLGGIGDWLRQPISGLPSASSFEGVIEGLSGSEAQNYISGLGGGGMFDTLTWGQGLGAAAGAGMGIYNLATAGGNTGKTIGGIASLIGAGVSLIPGIGQIAGPIIGLLGGLLPSLFGGTPEPPTVRASGALNFRGGRFGTTAGYGDAGGITSALGGLGDPMSQLLKAAGFTAADSPFGIVQQSLSKGDFSNATTFVTGPGGTRQWGQSSDPAMQKQAMDTAAAHVAHAMLMQADSGISGLMREGLGNYGQMNLDYAFTMDELGEAIQKLKTLDEAMANFGKNTTDAENAIKQVDAGFEAMIATAEEFNLSQQHMDAILTERNRLRLKATEDFANGIDDAYKALTDPQAAALQAMQRERQKDLENNAQFVNLVAGYRDRRLEIEAIYEQRRIDIIKQSGQQIEEYLRSLLPGGGLANLDQAGTLAGLKGTYEAARSQAMATPGSETAISAFTQAGTAYADFAMRYFGGNASYNKTRDQLIADAQALQAAGGYVPSGSAANFNGADSSEFTRLMAVISDLTEQLAIAVNQNAQLSGQVSRLLGNSNR